MNSFNTDDETKKIVKKYEGSNLSILTFNQSRFPRISKDSLLPIARDPYSTKSHWFPPGHGDVFAALANSGLLDQLLADGKEYLFISNGKNDFY
jgi:UTP--glucose-1-phosphate uridylyltransferase